MEDFFRDRVRRRAERVAVHDLLRELRRERGLNQRQMAELLGMPQSFVSKYETGERRLDILELRAVCGVLGISLHDFVDRLEARLGAVEEAGVRDNAVEEKN